MSQFNISPKVPSYFLEDFHSFLDYFLKNKIKLTPAGNLPGKVCYELNQKMADPQIDTSTRQRHFYYSKLYLFYHLASSGRILKSSRKGKSVLIQPDLDRVEEFFELSYTEQYFALLEILWVHVDWEVLHSPERPRSPAYRIHKLLGKIAAFKKLPSSLGEKQLKGNNWDLWPFSQYLTYFGFWEAEYHRLDQSRMLLLERCTPSTFGVEMAKILTTKRNINHWNLWERMDDGDFHFFLDSSDQDAGKFEYPEKSTEAFLLPFRNLFPEGELMHSLSLVESEFREGNHIFNVSFKHLPKVSRIISMPAKSTLHDLHIYIQQAVNFGNDHLYAFYLDNKLHSRFSYQSPMSDYGISANTILIGDLPMSEGHTFIYYFDFGFSWVFEVVLEKIDSHSLALEHGQIIESKGEAPEQYPNYDDEEW